MDKINNFPSVGSTGFVTDICWNSADGGDVGYFLPALSPNRLAQYICLHPISVKRTPKAGWPTSVSFHVWSSTLVHEERNTLDWPPTGELSFLKTSNLRTDMWSHMVYKRCEVSGILRCRRTGLKSEKTVRWIWIGHNICFIYAIMLIWLILVKVYTVLCSENASVSSYCEFLQLLFPGSLWNTPVSLRPPPNEAQSILIGPLAPSVVIGQSF